ncbi:secretion protein HlyD family protein [Desulfovibrio sp. X2]|uniref:efflux RND transporter periplasmic adaptor subunit n=1 Tax=Desulfovibrio sp. X2 TaxID=941449 RepID=UPI000358F379|nr:HlyD family efflux transporter periplasmic adaptor subunit [Desulfovibrio sp. X2]EPR43685.1 secretion protein HlyD family protein [Desulfovibrio sp. X2]
MKKLVWVIVVLLLAGGAWLLLRGGRDKGAVRIVSTQTLGRGTVRKVLEATGIVKAMVGAQVKIGARSSGVIESMLVKIGDHVNKGDLIASIDSREEKAEKIEAEAKLARDEAELKRVRTVYPLQIAEAEAQLREAQAEQDYADKNFERQEKLVAQELQAQDVLDQARQNSLTARSRVAARVATAARLKEEFTQELIKAHKAVSQDQAALEAVDIRLSYKRIVSPITGIVSQVTAQEGETVVSGLQVSNIITVLDPTRLEMWIYVDETDVGHVKPGLPVEFTVDAYPGTVFRGNIDRVYPEPEVRDNIVYYLAIVKLDPEQAEKLRPEMTTQCRIIVEVKKDVLALPNTALKWVGDRQYVYVEEPGGGVRRVQPELGLQGIETSEVLSGLSEGDKVATQIVLPSTALSGTAK